jgi:PadR family transcriptional regulator, regulatory protein PadR
MSLRKSNPAFLNGVPEMLILKLLAERAMHGYDLVQAIKSLSEERASTAGQNPIAARHPHPGPLPSRERERSQAGPLPSLRQAQVKQGEREKSHAVPDGSREGLAFGEGCIYPILHRLEAEGLLKASKAEVAGRVRVVYRATARGKTRLAETIGNWRAVVSSINRVLDGEGHGRPALA